MCGICGLVNLGQDRPVDDRIVVNMCTAMRHRGPDGVGFLRRPGVQFGHVRLSIIDLSGGAQPMSNEDGTVHVVFNGEIYNYPALRSRLLERGHVLRTHCDTEVLVHLYEDHGREMVQYLNGEFAFAIWDEKQRRFLLVRDRLGVKPIYYTESGGRLVFASEMASLLASGQVDRQVDRAVIDSYLVSHRIPCPRTIYSTCHSLLPGHLLEIAGDTVKVTPYWDFRMEPDTHRSEGDFADEVRALIDDSVRGQLMSDVPLGAFLSGGVDSSTVVTSMVAQATGVVKTFSIGFKERRYDESRYYKLIAARLGVEHHEFIFEPDLMNVLPKLVYHFGEPCAIGSAIPLYYLARLARQHVTVALSGDGADEVFAGYNIYRFLNSLRRLDRLGGPLIRSRLIGTILNHLVLNTASRLGNLTRRMRKIRRLLMLPVHQRAGMIGDLPGFHEPLTDGYATAALQPEYESAFRSAEREHDWLAPHLYADIKTLLPDEMFTKLDRMTMANSMEGRVPLVDYRLVELAARIPSRYKLKQGQVKAILKRAVRARLPQEVLARPKVGFIVPLDEWFRGPLCEMACDLLTGPSFRQAGYFRPQAVNLLLNRHMRALDNHGTDILALVMFELWRRGVHEQTSVPR